jgi:predicted nucleic acid-binding protein
MDYVVLDTDVASLNFRRRLPAAMVARLAGPVWCLTFVTVGELMQWMRLRNWSERNQAALEAWLSGFVLVDSSHQAAQIWGMLSAEGKRRGRPRPINDTWIAACCLAEGLPLATLNVKDYADFVDHHGLALVHG